MNKTQIGITGGIGSGKSIVAHILRIMQYPVYDTDAQAQQLMRTPHLQQQLIQHWGQEVILPNGEINRPLLAQQVFGNPQQLQQLNNIVHPAVREHYAQWVEQQQSAITFVESAILHQANMHTGLHQIWIVEADDETRIARVMQRNNLTRNQVTARIEAQSPPPHSNNTHIIINDNHTPLLPQIIKLLNNTTNY